MDLTGCGEQMRILKTGKFRECNAIAVVPTMDAEGSHFVPLAGELTRLGIAIIAVEDRPPAFRFSRSMNRGISEALEYGPDAIILSNDDVSNIVSLEGMIGTVRHYPDSYAVPYINSKRKAFIVATRRRQFVMAHTLANRAPFHALRVLSAFRGRKWALGAPYAGFGDPILCVQPFAVFPADILREYQFDENFPNGLEDDELGYRMHKVGIQGLTNSRWKVDHEGGPSFRLARKKEKIGLYLCSDAEMVMSAEYFYRKHFEA